MNIYHKLDQFIKSARFILEQRDFQKQAAPPNLSGVHYNPYLGYQNAAAFQRGVNLNPPMRKQPRRPTQPYKPSKYEQQRESAGLNSKGWKMWCQLMDKAQTPEHLKKMQELAPKLIGHMPDYQERFNYGMKRAVERVNNSSGTAYKWDEFGQKLSGQPAKPSSSTVGPSSRVPSMRGGSARSFGRSTAPSTAVRSANPVSSSTSKDIWGSVNPWIRQASPHYENHRNSSNIDLKLNASEDANIISSQIAQVLRQNPNLTIDDALTQLNIAGTALGNDVKNNLIRRLGSFNDFGEEGRAAAGFYQDMQNSQIVQPYNQQTEQYPQPNLQQPIQQQPVQQPAPQPMQPQTSMQQKPNRPWQRSEDGKTLTFSGNTPEEQLQSLQAYVDNYSQNILPKMKEKWSSMSEEDKALWKQQFAYTQKYLNDTKRQLLKQVQATQQQQSSTSMSGQTSPPGSMFRRNNTTAQPQATPSTRSIGAQPTTPPAQPTFRQRTNAAKPQPQVAPSTPKQPTVGWTGTSQKSNLTSNSVPAQPTTQQQAQPSTPQQLKPRTSSNKPLRFVNPNTGQPDQPQNIPQQQAQQTMPESRSIVPTNNVKPPKPKPAPVQPPATTITTTTNNNKLTWHNPNMVQQPTTTSTPQPQPVSDGWVGASVKPTPKSIQPAKKPIVVPPFDSNVNNQFNGAGKMGYGDKPYNGYPKPTPKKPTNKPKIKTPSKPEIDPISLNLQQQLSQLSKPEQTSSMSNLPYTPTEGMNPESRPVGFRDKEYSSGVYDL